MAMENSIKFPIPRGNHPHVIFFASPRWVCRGSKLNQSHVKLQSSFGVKRFIYITLYDCIHLCHSRKRKKEWNKSALKPWRRGSAAKHQTWAQVTPWMQPMTELGQVWHSICQTLQVSNDTCLKHTVVKDEAANYSVFMCFQQMVLWRQRPAKGLENSSSFRLLQGWRDWKTPEGRGRVPWCLTLGYRLKWPCCFDILFDVHVAMDPDFSLWHVMFKFWLFWLVTPSA